MHTCLLVAGEGKISDLMLPFMFKGDQETDDAKIDWFEVGGRFGAALPLKEPKKLRRYFGLLPKRTISQVVSAKKFEVNDNALIADPPAALLFRGKWSESKFFAQGGDLESWRKEFVLLYAEIPDDTTLTIVDCHS